MNGDNKCCEGTALTQDSSGDKICTGCGTIIDPAILLTEKQKEDADDEG